MSLWSNYLIKSVEIPENAKVGSDQHSLMLYWVQCFDVENIFIQVMFWFFNNHLSSKMVLKRPYSNSSCRALQYLSSFSWDISQLLTINPHSKKYFSSITVIINTFLFYIQDNLCWFVWDILKKNQTETNLISPPQSIETQLRYLWRIAWSDFMRNLKK